MPRNAFSLLGDWVKRVKEYECGEAFVHNGSSVCLSTVAKLGRCSTAPSCNEGPRSPGYMVKVPPLLQMQQR
eukprot:scaffold16219_cov97-Skeletonema_dohrnii-CCMP3373.AAC.6